MTSRMDRYDTNKSDTSSSRLSKNKKLYEELYTNTSYTEFTGVDSSHVIDLTSSDSPSSSRREEYQKTKDVSNALGKESSTIKKYESYQSYHFMEPSLKDYDINNVLENAKKNRNDIDELERKRKLRTTEYNILADLTEEKIKEHREKKREVLTKAEEEELEELIHTITSSTMRQEIDNELLGDLMPSGVDETIVSEDIVKQLEELKEISEERIDVQEDSELSKLDDSFYTKSMDLSDQDLIPVEQDDTSFKDAESDKSTIIRIFIVTVILILFLIIGVIVYNVL